MGKLNNGTLMTRDIARNMNNLGEMDRNLHDPIRKDTTGVPTNGYLIFRIKADNPGKCCHTIYFP